VAEFKDQLAITATGTGGAEKDLIAGSIDRQDTVASRILNLEGGSGVSRSSKG